MSAILYGLLQQLRGLPARVQALEDGGAALGDWTALDLRSGFVRNAAPALAAEPDPEVRLEGHTARIRGYLGGGPNGAGAQVMQLAAPHLPEDRQEFFVDTNLGVGILTFFADGAVTISNACNAITLSDVTYRVAS